MGKYRETISVEDYESVSMDSEDLEYVDLTEFNSTIDSIESRVIDIRNILDDIHHDKIDFSDVGEKISEALQLLVELESDLY